MFNVKALQNIDHLPLLEITMSQELDIAVLELELQTRKLDETYDAVKSLEQLCLFIADKGVSPGLLNLFEKDFKHIGIDMPVIVDDLSNIKEVSDFCLESAGETLTKAAIYLKDLIMRIFEAILALWKRYLGFNAIRLREIQDLREQKLIRTKVYDVNKWKTTALPCLFYSETLSIIKDVAVVKDDIDKLLANTKTVIPPKKYTNLGMQVNKDHRLIPIQTHDAAPLDAIRVDALSMVESGWESQDEIFNTSKDIVGILDYGLTLHSRVADRKATLFTVVRETSDEEILKATKTQIVLLSSLSSLYTRAAGRLAVTILRLLRHFPAKQK